VLAITLTSEQSAALGAMNVEALGAAQG